jgi:predicted DNA-binding ribbon-helix-helix protein
MIGDTPSIDLPSRSKKSAVIKRTVYIDGRKTSVCLEDAFWSILKQIAQAQGATVSETVTVIEKSRKVGATAREAVAPDKRRHSTIHAAN